MPLILASFAELPLQVGHWTHPSGQTGCTVILCPPGTWAGGEVRGAAPGTRETDLLRPGGLVQQAHAILLTGGSAFGLAAATGVMDYLRERGVGYGVGGTAVPVPIVPAAVIYDLGAVAGLAPDAAAGYAACQDAVSGAPRSANGRIGAGVGAQVGRMGGHDLSSPGGLGQAAVRAGAVVVGALMVVNALGEVRDPATGQIVAGVRAPNGAGFIPTLDLMTPPAPSAPPPGAPFHTLIGVVATNARLDQAALAVVTRMAYAGLARTITPAHTMFDGDTLFALSLPAAPNAGNDAPAVIIPPGPADPVLVSLVGALAAEAVSQAILNAVRA